MVSLINFEKIDDKLLDTEIFRVYSLEKFLITLNEKSIHFIKPRYWDDPFEGFFLEHAFWRSEKGTKVHWIPEIDRERFYAQCWTFNKESDFMWRIYAPKNDGIMVRSTISKIIHYLQEMPNGEFYIGKVAYHTQKEIKEKNFKINKSYDLLNLILESLLIKRAEFKEENELRLIHFSPDSSTPGDGPIGFSDPSAFDTFNKLLFDEIIIDPRLKKTTYNSTKRIIEALGYNGIIKQSRLYDKPDFLIEIT
jgi:hypothetical protein